MSKRAESRHTHPCWQRLAAFATSRLLATLLMTAGLSAGAQHLSPTPAVTGSPHLQRAQQLLEELRYTDALQALNAAWNTPGNDHETVAQILTLQGVVCATLGQHDRAKEYFRSLLYLRPSATLPSEFGPKRTASFYEMKGRLTPERILRFEPLPAVADSTGVRAVSATLKNDPEQLARQVRFHLRGIGAEWQVGEVPLEDQVASHRVVGASVEWWAELLGERRESLAVIGSAEQPLRAERAAPLVMPSPVVRESRSEVVVADPPLGLRPLAYGLFATGSAALAAGAVFGLQAVDSRSRIDHAARDDQGRVTGMSQRQAEELDAQVRRNATATNVALVGGALLMGAGIGVFFVFPGGAATVAPSPTGVAAVGVFE